MADTQVFTGELLRSAREARGWGQLRLIREMRAVGEQQGETLPTDASVKRRIASWENGRSVPDTFYGAVLCKALGRSAAELGLHHLDGQNAGLLDAAYPARPEEAVTAVTQLWRADLNGYEPLVHSEPSEPAWHEASVTWLVAPEPTPLAAEHGTGPRVGLADVAAIRTTMDVFVQLDDRFGGDHARHSVIQYLTRDVAPMLAGQYKESVGRALFSTAAESTLLAGWMSYDACHHGLAQRYLLQALRLAQDGDDRRLAGSVLSAMSHQATFLGRYRQAATLARAALMGISGVATPTLRAQFHAMEARALARTGDTRVRTGARRGREGARKPEHG